MRRGARRRATSGGYRLHRAPRVARGQRLLPVAVRGGRDPHARRRRRVGDREHRARARQPDRAHARAALSRTRSACSTRRSPTSRLQGQLRRVQADGPRALRRAGTPTSSSSNADRPEGRRLVPAGHAYFNYCQGLTMTSTKFDELFGGPPRQPESPITAARDGPRGLDPGGHRGDHAAHARATSTRERACKNLCLAGGVALNCVANGRILREGPFENIWIQPAAGDAGGALGAALFVWHQLLDNARDAAARRQHAGLAARAREYHGREIEALPRRSGRELPTLRRR